MAARVAVQRRMLAPIDASIGRIVAATARRSRAGDLADGGVAARECRAALRRLAARARAMADGGGGALAAALHARARRLGAVQSRNVAPAPRDPRGAHPNARDADTIAESVLGSLMTDMVGARAPGRADARVGGRRARALLLLAVVAALSAAM